MSSKTEPASGLLALDIGTEFIKCALAEPLDPKFRSGRLKLLGVSKTRQSAGAMRGGAIADIPAVVAGCETALSELEKKTGKTAKSVVVGISGELVKGSTTTIRYRRDAPAKPITDAELRELLEKIEARAEAKVREEISLETDNPEVDLSLINSALVSLSIDGYKINNPVGFRGSEVLIEYYTAFAPSFAVSAIEKVCVELELDLLAVVVEPFAVCRACLGDEIDVDFSAVLIDVGGGTTDLAVVDAGAICGTKMFNIAGQAFTRQIAETLGIKPETAERYKVNLEDDSILSDTVITKTTGALSRSLAVWLSGVEVALDEFHNVSPLPSDVFLSGGSSNLLPLEEALATANWYESLPFERRPVIHLLDPLTLPDFDFSDTEVASALDSSFITALGLLRVAVDTLIATPNQNSLRAKLSKLLSH